MSEVWELPEVTNASCSFFLNTMITCEGMWESHQNLCASGMRTPTRLGDYQIEQVEIAIVSFQQSPLPTISAERFNSVVGKHVSVEERLAD